MFLIEITRRFIKLFKRGAFVCASLSCDDLFIALTVVRCKADTLRSERPTSGYPSPSTTSVDGLQQPRGTLSCGGETQRWVRGGHLITRIEWIVVAVAACSAFRMTASITGRYHATCSFSPFPASPSLPTPLPLSLLRSPPTYRPLVPFGSSKAIARANVLKILYKVTARCRCVSREQTRGEALRKLISKSTRPPSSSFGRVVT